MENKLNFDPKITCKVSNPIPKETRTLYTIIAKREMLPNDQPMFRERGVSTGMSRALVGDFPDLFRI
jgi:hypothetical protein